MNDAIAVNAGFGWTAAGAWSSAALLLGLIIRQVNPWRIATIEADEQLRTDLIKRVEHLEETLALRDSERALDRHRINNLTQCLDMLIALLEINPDRAHDFVQRVKDMRSSQMASEALEKGMIHVARINPDAAKSKT